MFTLISSGLAYVDDNSKLSKVERYLDGNRTTYVVNGKLYLGIPQLVWVSQHTVTAFDNGKF